MMNEQERIYDTEVYDDERLSLEMERDARRYDKAYTEKDEVKLV